MATADEAEHSHFRPPGHVVVIHALRTQVDRRNDGDLTRVAPTGWKQVPEERPCSPSHIHAPRSDGPRRFLRYQGQMRRNSDTLYARSNSNSRRSFNAYLRNPETHRLRRRSSDSRSFSGQHHGRMVSKTFDVDQSTNPIDSEGDVQRCVHDPA